MAMTLRMLVLGLALCLAGCAAGSDPNAECARQRPADSRLPWGYFPGYGCGPVTPARAGVWS